MGALKGRWQSLRGLRIVINRKRDHDLACKWIRMCIVLHNLVIDVEGEEWAQYYYQQVPRERDGHEDRAVDDILGDEQAAEAEAAADAKRRGLVQDYAIYKDEVRRLRGRGRQND